MRRFFSWMGISIGVPLVVFLLSYFGLGMYRYFAPKQEDARREVFENTQSFVQGKNQDLAKYYLEYQGDETKRAAIAAVIQSQFAYVDADKITSPKMRAFLIEMRGF